MDRRKFIINSTIGGAAILAGTNLLGGTIGETADLPNELDGYVFEKYWQSTYRSRSAVTINWDVNAAAGDTLKKKYDSLYLKVFEESTKLGGANYIIASPEIASIFETTTTNWFSPATSLEFKSTVAPYPFDAILSIQYTGIVNSRWKLYKHPLFSTGKLTLGMSQHYGEGKIYVRFSSEEGIVILDPETFIPYRAIGSAKMAHRKLLTNSGKIIDMPKAVVSGQLIKALSLETGEYKLINTTVYKNVERRV
jgi:hypothetical protein